MSPTGRAGVVDSFVRSADRQIPIGTEVETVPLGRGGGGGGNDDAINGPRAGWLHGRELLAGWLGAKMATHDSHWRRRRSLPAGWMVRRKEGRK